VPSRYTPEEKANALVHLQANGGDVPYTAQQLGIPERTLFTWRRQWYAENQQQQSPLPLLPVSRPDFEDDLEVMVYLRKQIMTELLDMADSLRERTTFTTPTQRIHLLSQLLDRLIKLDHHLKPYRPPVEVGMRVTWQTGLYLRTDEGYRGPYAPNDLPKRWKEKYGPSTRLEIYWDDGTFTPIPDEGPILEHILTVKDFDEEPCEMDPDMDYEDNYEYGWDYRSS
jgi:transposase-like protein